MKGNKWLNLFNVIVSVPSYFKVNQLVWVKMIDVVLPRPITTNDTLISSSSIPHKYFKMTLLIVRNESS